MGLVGGNMINNLVAGLYFLEPNHPRLLYTNSTSKAPGNKRLIEMRILTLTIRGFA
jgi:hypothetical protein